MNQIADPGWACAQAVSRFFQHLDEGRAHEAAAQFIEDGIWLLRGQPVVGRAAVLASINSRPVTRVSRHLVTNVVVDADADAMIARYYVTICSHEEPFTGVPPLGSPVMILTCEDRLIETFSGWQFALRSSKVVFARAAGA